MDPLISPLLIAIALLFAVLAFVAQMKLFSINDTLKEIRNELLIARQERQTSKADAAQGA